MRNTANHLVLLAICVLMAGCGSGGNSAGDPGNRDLPVVDPTLFVALGERLPSVILPFTSELKGITLSPDGSKLYAIDKLHSSVSVFNLVTNRVQAVLDVGSRPGYIVLSPNGKRGYVSNRDSNSITVVDTVHDSVVTNIDVGSRPIGIAISPDSSTAYVTNSGDDSVSVINTTGNSIVATINVGQRPTVIALTRDGSKAYVANTASDNVTVIDTSNNRVLATKTVGDQPESLAISPDGSTIYVANEQGNSVSVLDASQLNRPAISIANVGTGPSGIVVSPDGSRVFVANARPSNDDCGLLENTLTIIDAESNSVIPEAREIEVGEAPLGMVITGNGAKLYVFSACTNTVSILETAKVPDQVANAISTLAISTQTRSTGIAISPDSARVYLAHPNAVSTIRVSDDSIISTTPGRGSGPTALAIAELDTGPLLLTANSGSDTVSVLDIIRNQHVSTLAVGSRPAHVAVSPDASTAYVANAGFDRQPDKTVSVIDIANAGSAGGSNGSGAVSTIEVDDGPIRTAISSDGATAIVANYGNFFPHDLGSGTSVSIIDTSLGTVTDSPVGTRPSDVQISPDGTTALVTNSSEFAFSLSSLDLASPGITTTSIDGFDRQSTRVAITTDNSKAVVTNYADHSITVLDMNTQSSSARIPTGGPNPSVLAITADDSKAYVLNSGDRTFRCNDTNCETGDSVFVLNLQDNSSAPEPIKVGRKPMRIALSANNAFVTNYFDNTVSVIDTSDDPVTGDTVIATLVVGTGPVGVITDDNGRAYVANSISNSVSVIGTSTSGAFAVLHTIAVNP